MHSLDRCAGENPAHCFLTRRLMFGQWGLPWNRWTCGNYSLLEWRRRCHTLLDVLWEKAPLAAISPVETCCAQMMFALNIWGRGSRISSTLPILVCHKDIPEMFYNRAKKNHKNPTVTAYVVRLSTCLIGLSNRACLFFKGFFLFFIFRSWTFLM